MPKTARPLYDMSKFQQYKFTHYSKCDIDAKRLDRIHNYTVTVALSTNCSTLSVRYNEKDKTLSLSLSLICNLFKRIRNYFYDLHK